MRVLIVDDDALAVRALARWVPDPAVAGSLDEGLRIVEQHRPIVAIFDRHFLGDPRTGTDAIRQVRAASPRSHVLIVTAHVDGRDQRRAIAAGAEGYFSKADGEALRDAVEALLDEDWSDGGVATALH